MPDENWLDLADVVRALRRELIEAAADGADAAIHFELGPVEVEFLVEVHREGSADTGVRFGVVSVGAKGSLASGTTHRVKLALTPKDSDGRSPEVYAESDRIPAR